MKRLLGALLFAATVLISFNYETAKSGQGTFLGVFDITDNINMPLNMPLDSSGYPQTPDSAVIHTYQDGSGVPLFNSFDNTPPVTGFGIEADVYRSDTALFLRSLISDIDGAGATTPYMMLIQVTLWDADLPTRTFATAWVTSNGQPDVNVVTVAANAIGAGDIANDAITSGTIATDAIGASEIAANAIGSSELAADAIGASEIAASAIGASELATDAIGSAQIASTGADEIGDNVWDQGLSAHTTTGTAGQILGDLDGVIATTGGVVTDAGNTSSTFKTDLLNTVNSHYVGELFAFTSGTNNHQARLITAYNGTTKFVTVTPAFEATPSGGDQFAVFAWGDIQNVLTVASGGITSGSFAAGAIDAAAVGTGAIDADAIATDAITSSEIAASAIGASEIGTGAIDADAIAADAIGASEIALDAIGASEIAADAIGASEIAANAITSSELAANAIGASQIATGAIDADAIAADAIGNSEIALDAIGASEIAADAIGASEIAAGAIGSSEISTDAIGAAQIAAGAIGASEIGTGAIDADAIAADAIGSSELATTGVSEIVNGVWDEAQSGHVTAGTFGSYLDSKVSTAGGSGASADAVWDEIAQGAIVETAGGNSTSQLQTNLAETTDGHYVGSVVLFLNGGQDGQSRLVTGYTGATGTITFEPPVTGIAAAGDSIRLFPGFNPFVFDTAGGAGVYGSTTFGYANQLGNYATSADLADATWDEPRAGHVTAGTFGEGVLVETVNSGAVTSASIATDAIGAAQIAADAIGASELATDAIGSAEIATDAIGAAEIALDAIGASEIATDAIGAAEIAAGAITATEAPNLDAAITTRLAPTTAGRTLDITATGEAGIDLNNVAGTLDAGEIGADAITADKIAADAITNSEIATNAIGALELASDAVDEIMEYDTAQISAGFGQMLKDTVAYQGQASGLTAAAVADAVWDEDSTGHGAANTMGLLLQNSGQAASAAAIADAVWDEPQSGHVTAGTFGAFLDEAVSGIDDNPWDNTTRTLTAFGFTLQGSDFAAGALNGKGDWNVGKTGYSLSAGGIDAIWDEPQAGHSTAGTFGLYLDGPISTAGSPTAIADAVWNEDTTGHGTAGSFGSLLDAKVSTAGGGSMTEASIADQVWDELLAGHAITGSAGEALANAGSGANATTIADAVWDEARAGHTTAGTFGLYLDQQISSLTGLSGSGAYTVSVTLTDTSATPDENLNGVYLFVNNLAESIVPYAARTDGNGVATFSLDDGTWIVFHTLNTVNQNIDTITVSGAAVSHTLKVYSANGDRTPVWGYLDKPGAGGRYANATVLARLLPIEDGAEMIVGDTMLAPVVNTTTTNALGYWQLPIYRNDEMTSIGSASDSSIYRFSFLDANGRTIRVGGKRWIDVYARASDTAADGSLKFIAMPRVDHE